MLLDGALDDRDTTEAWLKAMAKNGHRLSLLIEDLLTLSHLEHRSCSSIFAKSRSAAASGPCCRAHYAGDLRSVMRV